MGLFRIARRFVFYGSIAAALTVPAAYERGYNAAIEDCIYSSHNPHRSYEASDPLAPKTPKNKALEDLFSD